MVLKSLPTRTILGFSDLRAGWGMEKGPEGAGNRHKSQNAGRLSPLTSADGPVVAPGHDDVADPLAGDALGALQVVALVAGELDAGAQPGEGTEGTEGTSASSCPVHPRIWGQSHPLAPQAAAGREEGPALPPPLPLPVLMSKSQFLVTFQWEFHPQPCGFIHSSAFS